MSEPVKRKAAYEDLFSIPENMTGEIINGELVVTPRPSRKHIYTATALGGEVIPPYQFGRGGPGGWIILMEPEIGLGEHILVPDLAGWKEERFPDEEPHNWISVVPDWICEVLSPSTLKRDKMEKMPIYARRGVPYFWLIDPVAETLDVFRLEHGNWMVAGLYVEDAKVRAEPFTEIEINLSDLWRGERRRESSGDPPIQPSF
ncbi:MAG: Uma2 family endonuclease [Deltaproteobacteria bacterium]|nr:Uma2 family endonuclease [Deltaproteobacteria bacterium]